MAKKNMGCKHHVKRPRARLTEEMVLSWGTLPKYMEKNGWRRYRIEYGFECSCPEGLIYLPAGVEPDAIEDLLNA